MEIKLQKIHRVLNIDKSRWFKSYIDFNIEKNKNSYNELQKEAFNFMYQNKNGDKANLSFTDEDSLDYEIESRDLYEEFFESKEMFDFIEYSQDPKV